MERSYLRQQSKQGADKSASAYFVMATRKNARIYAVHLTTANQSGIRRASLVSVVNKKKTSAHHILTNFELPMLYTKIPKREKGV